jgi:hypothetical protein
MIKPIFTKENGTIKCYLTKTEKDIDSVALAPQWRELKENENVNDMPYFEVDSNECKELYEQLDKIFSDQKETIEQIREELYKSLVVEYEAKIKLLEEKVLEVKFIAQGRNEVLTEQLDALKEKADI